MTETEAGIGIIGAGRAGQAIARQLWRRGQPPGWIYSRTPERARRLAAEVGGQAAPSVAAVLAQAPTSL
ncbi:MAG: NAD(P)-binding domain-containing protein, partial [Candidatus Dormibacteria bacterium]